MPSATGTLIDAAEQIFAPRGLAELITSAYAAELLDDRLRDLITGPIRPLVTGHGKPGCAACCHTSSARPAA